MPDIGHNRRPAFARSDAHYTRAEAVIPLATQTFSKSAMNFVRGAAPLFLERGDGPHVWDLDGNRYLDYVAGLLCIVLGYRDPDVDAAIRAQLDRGISFSLATTLECELAERLVGLIPCAEMVRFAKNGSDATAAAVRLARAFTGRDKVALCGYHGWHDWSIGTTTRDLGIPAAVKGLSATFAFNDADSLATLLAREPGAYASIVLEPATTTAPAPGFLEAVRALADRHGAVLVFDEIVTGFRIALGGAQAFYGVTPDLACFGKAMGNGMPISAIVGRRDIMRVMEDVFVSGTFGGEALSLAASLATIDKLERGNGVERLKALGRRLAGVLGDGLAASGLDRHFAVGGQDWWVRLGHVRAGGSSPVIATSLLRQEAAAHGLLMGAGLNLCLAQDAPDVIAETTGAWQATCTATAAALADREPARHLRGTPIEPVFRVRAT